MAEQDRIEPRDEEDVEYQELVNAGVAHALRLWRTNGDGDAQFDGFQKFWEDTDDEILIGVMTALLVVVDEDHPGKTPVINLYGEPGPTLRFTQ